MKPIGRSDEKSPETLLIDHLPRLDMLTAYLNGWSSHLVNVTGCSARSRGTPIAPDQTWIHQLRYVDRGVQVG